MRTKPLYFYRITDKVYVIYKLSNYTTYPVKEIHVGLAYNRQQNYSVKFLKLKEKYNLLEQEGTQITSNSHSDFCSRLYLGHKFNEFILPSNCLEYCKHFYNTKFQNRKRKNDLGLYIHTSLEAKYKEIEKVKELMKVNKDAYQLIYDVLNEFIEKLKNIQNQIDNL